MAASKVSIKLLIDRNAGKVLFAEVGKDFVDFLFYLLSLPAGTIINLLREKNMAGCLSNLYQSIENLSQTYMQPNQHKSSVLNPTSKLLGISQMPLLLSCQESNTRKFYSCPNKISRNRNNIQMLGGDELTHFYVTDVPNLVCPGCKAVMNTELAYVSPAAASNNVAAVAEGGGFVKGVVTYMVMDNLEVTPMSTISSITLLNKYNVKDVGALEEIVLDVGVNEGLKLLKASLECKNALTSVFLGN